MLAHATAHPPWQVPGEVPLWVYTCCTGATHLTSAATHVYPDSHLLEKVDHLGIVATIVGTPITGRRAQQAQRAQRARAPPPCCCCASLLCCPLEHLN